MEINNGLNGITAVLVNVETATKALDISRSRFYELVRAGQIRVVRLGRRGTRVPWSEIERLAKYGVEDGPFK